MYLEISIVQKLARTFLRYPARTQLYLPNKTSSESYYTAFCNSIIQFTNYFSILFFAILNYINCTPPSLIAKGFEPHRSRWEAKRIRNPRLANMISIWLFAEMLFKKSVWSLKKTICNNFYVFPMINISWYFGLDC